MKKIKFTSAHWGTYEVSKGVGNKFKLLPFKEDKNPSEIGRGMESALESNSRIRKPSIRKGWLEHKNNRKRVKVVKSRDS